MIAPNRHFSPLPSPALAGFGALLALGCGGKDDGGDRPLPFCFAMSDADSFELEPLDDDPSSGEIEGRLLTDESGDLRDPQIIAFVEYTLENLDVGGTPQLGETDVEGNFYERVGAGNWRLRLVAARGRFDCENEVDLVVEAGQTTHACIDVGCE